MQESDPNRGDLQKSLAHGSLRPFDAAGGRIEMPSLDFEAEKAAFREYYNDNAQRLDQAKKAFLTLLSSLLAHARVRTR